MVFVGIYIQITCSVYGSNVYSDSIQLQKSLSDGVDTCSMMIIKYSMPEFSMVDKFVSVE